MKTKERKELFAKNLNELKKALVEAKEALVTLNLEKAQNKLKNTRSIFWKKKEIANIKTAIREKELMSENA
jgi:ribosomal protein L29